MKAEQLFLLINQIDDRLIADAEITAERPVEVVMERRFPFGGILACAACAAALVICVIAVMNARGNITPPVSTVISANGSSSEIAPVSSDNVSSETSETSESGEPSTVIGISDEVVWGMGKSFDEITERYGNVASGNHNVYTFENGYGRYVWDSKGIDLQQPDRAINIEIVRGNGGCLRIDNIKPSDLFGGEFTSVSFEELAENGFEPGPVDESPYTMYDGFRFRAFTHPSYENITFVALYSEETGVIDDKASITIRLNES